MKQTVVSAPEPDLLVEHLPYRIHMVSNLVRQVTGLATISHLPVDPKITIRELRVLFILGANGPTAPVQIAKLAGIDNATVTRAVASLRKKGLVETQSNSEDGRAKYVVFTAKGQKTSDAILPLLTARGEALETAFTPEERDLFLRLLDKLRRRCEDFLEA